MRLRKTFSVLAVLLALGGSAEAGWVVEWTNVATKIDGVQLPAEPSSMQIQNDRVRLTQPRNITIIDYGKDVFTIMNPETESFWSGSVDQYVEELTKKRGKELQKRTGRPRPPKAARVPAIDESNLAVITIRKSDQTKEIAGHRAVKYEILSDGELFQEMWLAEGLDLSKDLDPGKFLAFQRKMSAGMVGKSGQAYQALYRNKEYQDLVSKGFALEIKTKHIAGGFDRTVTAIRKDDLGKGTFEVPDTYRRVHLTDVLPMSEPADGETQPKPVLPGGAPPANPAIKN